MITVDNLSFQYPYSQSLTLQAISLHIEPGELVLLTGPSGSGKSTLLHCLKGLVPHLYGGKLAGRIVIDGIDLSQSSVADIARRVGLVMQDPETQFCNLFVRDEVAFGVENLKLPREVCLAKTEESLGTVNLSHMAERSVMELSGGEKQRVAIASVLAMDVPVLLLDEPTANLDSRSGRDVLQFITQLKEMGKTILLVQHDLDEMIHVADKLLILESGSVVDFDDPRRVIDKHRERLTIDHNVGLPQITQAALEASKWLQFERLPLTADEFCGGIGPSQISLPLAGILEAPQLSTGSTQKFVEANGVTFAYSSDQVVRDVTLQVNRGEVLAIVGKNGSGKSTLARLLVGLLEPQAGSVELNGHSLASMTRHEIHRQTGYVFQYPEHQFLASTVKNEVAYGLEVQGKPPEERARRVTEALQMLQLSGMEDRHPFSLSGGEKRRLSVATMLVLQPDLLILDEPTYGLDEGNLMHLVRFIFDQLRAQGVTIVFITHDMRLVAEHADRVLVMHEGRLIFDGLPAEFFHNDTLIRQAELLPPPVVELTDALVARGIPLPAHIVTLEQFGRAISGLPAPSRRTNA